MTTVENMASSVLYGTESVRNNDKRVALKEVYITEDASKEMEDHANEGEPLEIGGFLLGKPVMIHDDNNVSNPCSRDDDLATWVLKTVRGDCISQRGHVTIESSSYDRAWREIKCNNDDLIIVGWYHTHPDIGIFLSSTDVNNMESHYREPYQIAIVIDPIRNERDVFGWRGGRVDSNTRVKSYIFTGNDYKKYFHEKCDEVYW